MIRLDLLFLWTTGRPKCVGRGYDPSGWRTESEVTVSRGESFSEAGGSASPSEVQRMPRLLRRSWRRATVLTSCSLSPSKVKTCSWSRHSDRARVCTWLSRLAMRACETWPEKREGGGEQKTASRRDLRCRVCYLQLLQQVKVLLPQALIGPFQLGCSLLLIEGRGRVQQLVLQDVVFHLVGLQLLGNVHLTDLRRQQGVNGEPSLDEQTSEIR